MANQQTSYKLLGRYMTGNAVTAYELETDTGKRVKATSGLMGFLVGQGRVVNVTGYVNNNTVGFKGKGIDITSLPVIKEQNSKAKRQPFSDDENTLEHFGKAPEVASYLYNDTKKSNSAIILGVQMDRHNKGKEYSYIKCVAWDDNKIKMIAKPDNKLSTCITYELAFHRKYELIHSSIRLVDKSFHKAQIKAFSIEGDRQEELLKLFKNIIEYLQDDSVERFTQQGIYN